MNSHMCKMLLWFYEFFSDFKLAKMLVVKLSMLNPMAFHHCECLQFRTLPPASRHRGTEEAILPLQPCGFSVAFSGLEEEILLLRATENESWCVLTAPSVYSHPSQMIRNRLRRIELQNNGTGRYWVDF